MSARNQDHAPMWDFLAPGFLHQLRNALFAIQGQAQLLDPASGGAKNKAEILAAVKRAQGVTQVLRFLAGDRGTAQPGILLPRLVELLRVPLRDRGLAVSCQHSSRETPVRVDGALLCEAVIQAAMGIAARMPTGFRGAVAMDLCAQGPETVEITMRLLAEKAQLPFQVDLVAVQQELCRLLSVHGGTAVLVDQLLALHLPAALAEAERGTEGSTGAVG